MLNAKQDQVLTLILGGKTQAAAAEEAGVAAETVSRWKRDAEFVAELNRRRQETWEAQREELRSLADDALAVFADALGDEDIKVRLRAARDILDRVGLDEVSRPRGATTAPGVEKDRRRQEAWEDLLSW